MGEVYRATDTKLGRDVALKVLPAEMARDPERLARFQREARAVAALNHPHIVTLYSVEEADGVHFLTMELIEGQSLERRIPAGGLSIEQIIEIANALAQALAAAHDKGIVHRDLKPANVMVTTDGRVKVLDFGLAKDVGAGKPSDATLTSAGQTQLGVVMGTPAYMSPEQIAGRAVDHRTSFAIWRDNRRQKQCRFPPPRALSGPTLPARFALSRGSGLRCCRSSTAAPTPTSWHWPRGCRRTW